MLKTSFPKKQFKEIYYKDLIKNSFCFAPSKYSNFIINEKVNYSILNDIVTFSNKRKKIERNQKYFYTEIGDVNTQTGFIEHKNYFGYNLPLDNVLEIKQNDILISTVRTYRKGIGIISSNEENMVSSPAFLNIREVNPKITKEYLLSVLRSDFFVEQILFFQNRGLYPRLDKDSTKNIYIPIPKNKESLNYISLLMKEIITKEKQIINRRNLINKLIKDELLNNQKDYNFNFEYPKYNEILLNKRLDTALYNKEYKNIIHILKNYKNGYSCLLENFKFNSGDTPKKFIITKNNDNNIFWISNKDIINTRILYPQEIIINKKVEKVKYLEYSDIIFSRRAPVGNPSIYLNKKSQKYIVNEARKFFD